MALPIKIIPKGNQKFLMARLQCLRDTGELVLDGIEELEDLRAICCGYPIDSSSSSSSFSSSDSSGGGGSSSSGPVETFEILTEDSFHMLLEDNDNIILEH